MPTRPAVLDLMITELDAFTVIRRAREQGDVPILVLSARGAVGRVARRRYAR